MGTGTRQGKIVEATLGPEFTSETAPVNGIALHYVRGGKGIPIILIHGFPQDWFEYHAIMPRLAKQYDVIAVDLCGIGGSTSRSHGFDAASLAEDIHQLAETLKLEPACIVGHDVGGMVAYALARRYPQSTRSAVLLDVALPGIEGSDEIAGHPAMWHVGFMQVPGLAERLVNDRQADYFAYFFQFGKFTPSDVDHFVSAYASPVQLHSVFEMYRAFPTNAEFNSRQLETNQIPFFIGAGDGSPFADLISKQADGLRANGCANVESGLIPNAVHYVVEDQPDEVARLIEQYVTLLSSDPPCIENKSQKRSPG
jgi:pimeloyl-ACP methyl ester carboxylesterase